MDAYEIPTLDPVEPEFDDAAELRAYVDAALADSALLGDDY